MISLFSAPVLTLSADAVRDLEGGDALSGLWTTFTKCKESVKDGSRLENIAWRLWHLELVAAQSYRPLTPDTSSPTPLEAGQDFPFYVSEHQAQPDPSREQSTQQLALAPSYPLLAPPRVSPDRASFTSSMGSSNRISIGRLKPTPSVGKFIVAMLPNSSIELMLLPSPAAAGTDPLLSPRSGPRRLIDQHKYMTLPAVCLPFTPLAGSAPHVVVVTPNPHPTPPATPILNHARVHQLPPLESTHLPPPFHSAKIMTTPRSEARLSPPCPSRVTEAAQLQVLKRDFFLQESPERTSPTYSARSDTASPCAARAVLKEAEANSGGSSTLHKGSAVSNHPSKMKRKGTAVVRHGGRPALRRWQRTSSQRPPPVAVAKQPAPTKRTPSPAKPAVTQKAIGRRVVVADSGSDSDFETDSNGGSWSPEEVSAVEEPTKESKEEIRLKEAALDAQRQRDMFAKVPNCSYSNLDRSRSGLLSALLNPDPNIFPTNHPYRASHSTQDMTQPPRRGNALSGLSVMAPLSPSKSAAAIPQAVQATVRPPPSGPSGLSALAGMGACNGDRAQPNPPPARPPVTTTAVAAGPSRPALQTMTAAPIPIGHPYNLPPPSAPSTPRTTRRQMLATELSGSLRLQLLWQRKVMGPTQLKQSATVFIGSGLWPMTPLASGQSSRRGSNGGSTAAGGGAEETERAESKRRAMARNRSWAGDYHYSGW